MSWNKKKKLKKIKKDAGHQKINLQKLTEKLKIIKKLKRKNKFII
jgi:hypothetical protein